MAGPPPIARDADGPRADLDILLGLLLGEAAALVERNGEFYPFAARWYADAPAPELLRPATEDEFPLGEALAAELREALRLDAGAAALRAAGLCLDVIVEIPDQGRTDAARAALEHRDGLAMVAYLPYRRDGERWVFDDMVVTPGEPEVFAPGTE